MGKEQEKHLQNINKYIKNALQKASRIGIHISVITVLVYDVDENKQRVDVRIIHNRQEILKTKLK